MYKFLNVLTALVLTVCLIGCERIDDSDPDPTYNTTGIWVLNSMERVENYKSFSPGNKINLYLAKGEAEHFQIVLETEERGSISFEQVNPREGISVSLSEIRVFENEFDPLVPVTTDLSTKTQLIKLWVTYETSINAQEGEFTDKLRFTGTAGNYEVEVACKVYNVAIPVKPSVPAIMGINPLRVSSAAQGEAMYEKRKEFMDELLKRRMQPYMCLWHPNGVPMAVECISSPYPWNDSRTLDYMADERLTHLLLPSHLVTTEEIKTFANQVTTRFPQKKQVYYVRDEPTSIADYQLIQDKSVEIKSINSKAQVLTTFYRGPTDPNNTDFNDLLSVWDHLNGYTDIFCIGVWALQNKEDRAERCRLKSGNQEEFWTYTAMGDRPGLTHANGTTSIDNHAIMWRIYKERAEGYLFWVVNAFSSLSPLRSRSELPEGDGVLVYPGESFNSETPVISMRLERFRDGLEDFELMYLLEKKTSRAHVLSILENVYKGPAAVSTNPNHVIAFKVKLMEEILK